MEPRRADAYETQYMPTGGSLLHRERMIQQFHWIFIVMALVPLVASIAILGASFFTAIPALAALGPFALAAMFAAMWVLFSVMRVHVSTREVLIQLGPLGPRFALERIEQCRVVPRPRGRFSAGKYRVLPDGTREHWFMMSTKQDELVELVARDEQGRVHRVMLSSLDPRRLVEAIEHARTQRVSSAVRVDAVDPAPKHVEEVERDGLDARVDHERER